MPLSEEVLAERRRCADAARKIMDLAQNKAVKWGDGRAFDFDVAVHVAEGILLEIENP